MRRMCLLLLMISMSPVLADNATVRDRNGNPLYHLESQGNRTYVRDNAGNPHGYYQQTPGGGTEFRTNAGNLVTRTK